MTMRSLQQLGFKCNCFIVNLFARHADQNTQLPVNLIMQLLVQNLLPTAALEALEQAPAVMGLLSFILVRDQAQRPSAGDVHDRWAIPHQPDCLIKASNKSL